MIFPSFGQFQRWSKKYAVIPFWAEYKPSSARSDPFPYFLSAAKDKRSTFFLDGFNSRPDSRYSYFPLSEPVQTYSVKNQKDLAKTWKAARSWSASHRGPRLDKELPPFYGGAVGILSYDCGRFFEPGWKSPKPPDPLKFPLLEFGIFNEVFCLDHQTGKSFVFSCAPIEKNRPARWKQIYSNQKNRLTQLLGSVKLKHLSLNAKSSSVPSLIKGGVGGFKEFKITSNKTRFIQCARRIKEYIAAGDIYQANLSQRFEFGFEGTALGFFKKLRKINPSPYSCFFRLPGRELAGCSPELLIKKRGEFLETRPIAGTRPRGGTPLLDRRLKGELLLNEKERAEHIMLVDLERNDLGKVCERGRVQVTEKMAVEKYSHVMHIVSHLKGTIKTGKDIFDAVEAVFPGGTITGCPKIRCMEILDEIEPVARGPFFGSAGWIGYQGDGELNLLIRTAVVKPDARFEMRDKSKIKKYPISHIQYPASRIFIQAGSGIVADSDPETEFEESLNKAKALILAL